MRVKCDACGREFNKVYDDMEPHLCRTCQGLSREACAECEGWCCEKPNTEKRIALLDEEKERFGFKRDWMWADPCRYRDPVTGHCIPVSYTHLRAHETRHDLVCRLLLEKKKTNTNMHA